LIGGDCLKQIIWDFDNTLAYRDGMWTQSLCNVLERNGYIEYAYDAIKDCFRSGLPWHFPYKAHSEYFNDLGWWDFTNITVSKAVSAAGIEGEENRRLTLQFRDEYLKKSEWHLFEDTKETLEKASMMGYGSIILSNHTPELIDIVRHLGIEGYFSEVISSALAGYEKPDPRMFGLAMRDKHPDEFVMIGDNYSADILGALDLGINAVLVRSANDNDYDKYSENLTEIWKYIIQV
jgi:putative hydrolase of the HAD superfamily